MTMGFRLGTGRVERCAWSAAAALALMAAIVATPGCSSSSRDRGRIRVTGSIAFEGKPLGHGSVLFARVSDRDVASAPIRPGGTFTVSLLPGDYNVAVRCFSTGTTACTAEDWAEPTSLIPEKYTDATTSGLTVSVTNGAGPVSLSLSR